MSLPTPNRRADKSSSKNQIAGFSKGDEVLDIELMHQFERLGAIFRVKDFETAYNTGYQGPFTRLTKLA